MAAALAFVTRHDCTCRTAQTQQPSETSGQLSPFRNLTAALRQRIGHQQGEKKLAWPRVFFFLTGSRGGGAAAANPLVVAHQPIGEHLRENRRGKLHETASRNRFVGWSFFSSLYVHGAVLCVRCSVRLTNFTLPPPLTFAGSCAALLPRRRRHRTTKSLSKISPFSFFFFIAYLYDAV